MGGKIHSFFLSSIHLNLFFPFFLVGSRCSPQLWTGTGLDWKDSACTHVEMSPALTKTKQKGRGRKKGASAGTAWMDDRCKCHCAETVTIFFSCLFLVMPEQEEQTELDSEMLGQSGRWAF
ncbi:hypothetical protein CDEST_01391 [Colletotrichum destructivum]|uniref:Secreted protein n=1 Tax=Colletotrichum destructivum TaxID=34406 RepID=A0AAX4HYZ2_9PEZI|nr:hypothetical protein CDEST_01391 [Colletotrichum destructivum]